jgi:hypothetical protein
MKEKENVKQNLLSALKNGGRGETKVWENGVCIGKLIFSVSKIGNSVRVYPYYFKAENVANEVTKIQNDLIDFIKIIKDSHLYIMQPSIESGRIDYKTTLLQKNILIKLASIFHQSWKIEKKEEMTTKIAAAKKSGPLVYSMKEVVKK